MAYDALAKYYDQLMSHVDFTPWLSMFCPHVQEGDIVLDLACGTGTLAQLLAEKGYQVIGVDASAAMLMEARQKGSGPLFIQQRMEKLDLYGTVNAAVCSLDGMNYLTNREGFVQALRRVHLFLEPGGVFLFDVKTPQALAAMDGRSYVSQTEQVFCAWESTWHSPLCRHEITVFEKSGKLWSRFRESHNQRAYSMEFIEASMKEVGYKEIFFRDDILPEQGRVFVIGRK